MPGSPSPRLVESVLRCYPRRWRSRHGEEAAEIATLLIRDGTPAYRVAWSYLVGAVRMRLVIGPRRRVGAVAGALLLAAGGFGAPLALLSSSAPANAASVTHTRAARPRPAGPRGGEAQPAGPRHGGECGAPGRCDRHGHC